MASGSVVSLTPSKVETILRGREAARYTTAAALIVLIYDHILTFGDEINLVWRAKNTWLKALFLLSRYSILVFILVAAHETATLSSAGLNNHFCQVWVVWVSLGSVTATFICNVFAMQRIDALWSRNRKVRIVMITASSTTYLASGGAAIYAMFAYLNGNVTYSPQLKTCVIDHRVDTSVIAYAIPIAFDLLLFILVCWNAFDRPRHLHTAIIKQLYVDGALYFVLTLSLRITTILIYLVANEGYLQLVIYFLWGMIPASMHRMVIVVSKQVALSRNLTLVPGLVLSQYHLVHTTDAPFKLTHLNSSGRDLETGKPIEFQAITVETHVDKVVQ